MSDARRSREVNDARHKREVNDARHKRDASPVGGEFRIGFLVHDVSRLRQVVFDQAMKPYGVTRAQWWALAQLTRHDPKGGMTQAELARRMRTSRAVVHRLLDADDPSITLSTISRAASALGKSVHVQLAGT